MSDQNQDEEPPLPFYKAPLGRGAINGVFLFCLLIATQHFGWVAPGPPVTAENVMRFAFFGVAMAVIMYFWTGRRLKRDQARREADRLARIRAEAYDSDENGDEKNGSEK
jgi:hypothetical protein